MKASKKIFITVIVLLTIISSCSVQSFYPLYTEDVLIKNNTLLGKWETTQDNGFSKNEKDTLVWEISFRDTKLVSGQSPFDLKNKEVPNEYTYTLNLYNKSSPNKSTEFELHLVKLEGKTYIDFFPTQFNPENDILGFHLMGVHTFAKVDVSADKIIVDWFDSESFGKKLEEGKIRIKHENNGVNILLTSQPKELQKFVAKYSNDEEAFNKDFQFVLKPQ